MNLRTSNQDKKPREGRAGAEERMKEQKWKQKTNIISNNLHKTKKYSKILIKRLWSKTTKIEPISSLAAFRTFQNRAG